MGNGQPGLISTGNSMSTIFGLSQQEKFKVNWIQQEKKGNQDSFNGKYQWGVKSIFQWEIVGLQYMAHLSRKKCRRSWNQWERRDNQGLISMENSVFTIFGLSQWEKFKVSWIWWEKNGNQDSFEWEISGSQWMVYQAELNGKGRTTRGSFQQEITSLGVLCILF